MFDGTQERGGHDVLCFLAAVNASPGEAQHLLAVGQYEIPPPSDDLEGQRLWGRMRHERNPLRNPLIHEELFRRRCQYTCSG